MIRTPFGTKRAGFTPEEDTDDEMGQGSLPGPAPTGGDAGPPPQPGDADADGRAGEKGLPKPEQVHLGPATSAAISCGACGNFDGQNCGILQQPVQPTQTCDAFSPSPGLAGIHPDAISIGPDERSSRVRQGRHVPFPL